MASKLNIFNALPNAPSDDEDDHGHKGSQSGQGGAKKDRVRNRGGKKPEGGNEAKPVGGHGAKDLKARDHNLKKAGNDLDHPHTLDRKSGTGEPAFAKKDKKGGAGRFNKGTFKDDLRGPRAEGEKDEEGQEQGSQSEEEDNTVTWDDYVSKGTTAETKQQVNDTKLKITDDQLKKELGKATLLQTRKDVQVDDRQETHKKNKNTPVVGMNTEHAELLGFRTGFKVFDDKKKRQFGDRAEKGGDKPAKEGEGEKTEAGATEEKKAEEPVAEGTTATTTKADEKSPEGGHKGGYRGGNRGGNRGEHRGEGKGYRHHDDKGHRGEGRGGYKGEGGYKGDGGYKGGNKGGPKKATFNAEDESLFPKLG